MGEAIVINAETREIKVPDSERAFGVAGERKVEVKHFRIDGRYVRGTDLAQGFVWKVSCENANKEICADPIDSIIADADSIEFDWIVGAAPMAYKGTMHFAICATRVDAAGNILQEWHSHMGAGDVANGIEATVQSIGGQELLAYLQTTAEQVRQYAATVAATAGTVQALADQVATDASEASTAAAKAKSLVDSMPDDYSGALTDIGDLKKQTAALDAGKISKFYASSQGETNLPDSDDGRIVDLKLYGRSEQKQYSGKNLFPPVTYSGNASDLQIDAADGAVHLKGTPNDGVNFPIIGAWDASSPTIFTLPAGTYTLTGFGEWLSTPRLNLVYVENGNLTSVSGNKVLTLDKDTNFIAVFVYTAANVALDITFRPMIEKGNTATDYEPYVGGIPSPNPEYPQEIKSVVKPTVRIYGKNLIDYRVADVITSRVVYKNGLIVSTQDGRDERAWRYTNSEYKVSLPAGTYIVTVTIKTPTTSDTGYLRILNTSNTIIANIPIESTAVGVFSATFALNSESKIGVLFKAYKASFTIQLERGSTATEYQPYTETTAALPYTLNAIPVSSGGNVSIDGQQYIADYVDVEKGKFVRIVGTSEFVGNESFYHEPSWVAGCYLEAVHITDALPVQGYGTVANLLCNRARIFTPADLAAGTHKGVGFGAGGFFINFGSDYDTQDKLKSYLKSHPILVYYQLATPTEIDLTAEEIAAFKDLASYYPATNVSCASDQLDGYTVFNYPISLANGWDYVKQQIGDTRDYIYDMDLMAAEAYVSAAYAAALTELEVE